MADIRAIPKSLLIHTVTHVKTEDADRWGNAGLKEQIELQYVRIEPSSKVVRDKNNAEIQMAAILIYDCKNSRPQGVAFVQDDIIIFHNQKYSVQFVEPLYDGKKLHHYELGLIKHA